MRKVSTLASAAVVAVALVSAPQVSLADDARPPDSEFQKVVLNDSPGEPMNLAVLPDRRVLHTTRSGQVRMHDPRTGLNTIAAELDVYRHDESGVQNIAVDPGFDGVSNRWVYLYYTPVLDVEGSAPHDGEPADFEPFDGYLQLSRFELVGDKLDLSSEQKILEVAQSRGICCHYAGDIAFDADGNLYLSTGDDTNAFGSGGYTPIDERPNRNPAFDAQRSSANTNDLRGKVLRITVADDGSYTIPDGNLFEPGTPGARPEIYLMGLRNPFRMEINQNTGQLYVADYSPDARQADPQRGPKGHAKWFVTTEPGNYGWPYCSTPDMPYVDYDFATQTSGEEFDCSAPVNDSPRNTGLSELPPVAAPQVWYSYDESEQFPELGTGGQGPMAGPAYDYDVATTRGRAPVAWPEYYDGVPLFYEWTRDYIKAFHLDDSGELTGIEDVLSSMRFDNIMDLEFGPDGALYVLEYGKGFFRENPEAKLARIDYIGPGGNRSPIPQVSADVESGQAPLTVSFSSEGTHDPDGDRLLYEWDFTSDGTVDSRQPNPTHTYTENGLYTATLKVTDVGGRDRGRSASAEVDIVVGEIPEISFVKPVEGQDFTFGDVVEYEVDITHDDEVDCSAVEVTYILGHDSHGHPQTTVTGCTGSIETEVPGGHDPKEDNLFAVFDATYTAPSGLSASAEVRLEPTG